MTEHREQKLEYRHLYFCPSWTKIEWRFGPDELAHELAEDWVEDEDDEGEARRIAEDVEIRVVS